MEGKQDGVYYRLPSGVLLDDRVAWDDLDLDKAADALGARLWATILPDLEDVQIVRWEHVREQLARGVSAKVRSRHEVLGLSQEDLDFRYGGISPVEPGRAVVLLTGSIMTGRTVTNLLRVLRRMEAEPLAVATVVDGRVDCGSPLSTFAGPVPVISCVRHALVVDPETAATGTILDLDTSGREIRVHPRRPPEIPAARFVSWLERHEDSGMYIGHIERRRAGSGAYYRRARHFSTYLHMGRLIAQDADPIKAVAVNTRRTLERDPPQPLKIVYPATEGNIAEELALAVAAHLSEEAKHTVRVIGARRGAGGEWRIPEEHWEECTAVIIDWGAVTTRTIRSLMALALRNGAARIHAAVLTSQMPEEAERDLTTMSSMRGERVIGSEGSRSARHGAHRAEPLASVEVPVSASFLAHVPMGMAPITECDLCWLAHEFRRHGVEAPTRMLRQLARRKSELYRPRKRSDFLDMPVTDLVGACMEPGDAVKVWECHRLLDQMESSSEARAQVRQAVLDLSSEPRDSAALTAWIRLLIIEPYWLNRPPLAAEETRSAIAVACVAILTDGAHRYAPGVRWQAAIILRVASKRAFIESFARVMSSSADDDTVAAEICSGMLTLLEKP